MTIAALALNDLEISNELMQESMAELVGGIRHNTGTRYKYLGKTYQYKRYGFLKYRRSVYHYDKIVTTAYHTYGSWKFVGIGF